MSMFSQRAASHKVEPSSPHNVFISLSNHPDILSNPWWLDHNVYSSAHILPKKTTYIETNKEEKEHKLPKSTMKVSEEFPVSLTSPGIHSLHTSLSRRVWTLFGWDLHMAISALLYPLKKSFPMYLFTVIVCVCRCSLTCEHTCLYLWNHLASPLLPLW